MIITKVRVGLIALVASASFATASLAPAASQAHATFRPGGIAEASTCTYAGQTYSQGAVVRQDDGKLHECLPDGSWGAGYPGHHHAVAQRHR